MSVERIERREINSVRLTAVDWNDVFGISHGQTIVDALAPFDEKPLFIQPPVEGLVDRVKTAWEGIQPSTYQAIDQYSVISLSEFDSARLTAERQLPTSLRVLYAATWSNWDIGHLLSSKNINVVYLDRVLDKVHHERNLDPIVKAFKILGRFSNGMFDEVYKETMNRSLGFCSWGEGGNTYMRIGERVFASNLRFYLEVTDFWGKPYPLVRNIGRLLERYIVFMAAEMTSEAEKMKAFTDLYLAGNFPAGILQQGKEFGYSCVAITLVA